ncbi:MAG: hypothetical protein OXE94_00915 [Aestuariivita sp.]|nr:hypothetical protein [Aestuariivita sp.]MCY4287436.1 hypothetical protein [Aestuariivita sp.]MCY4345502.1 hypothetical protein [Aestuariivita sp.]
MRCRKIILPLNIPGSSDIAGMLGATDRKTHGWTDRYKLPIFEPQQEQAFLDAYNWLIKTRCLLDPAAL